MLASNGGPERIASTVDGVHEGDFGTVNSVEALEELLECRAQFVEQSSLTGEDGVAAVFGRLQHSEHRICWRVDLMRIIGVVFSTEISVSSNVTALVSLPCPYCHGQDALTYPAR